MWSQDASTRLVASNHIVARTLQLKESLSLLYFELDHDYVAIESNDSYLASRPFAASQVTSYVVVVAVCTIHSRLATQSRHSSR